MIKILTLNELKELVELTEREDTTWTRWINQATNDVDNLCNGYVLKTFEATTKKYVDDAIAASLRPYKKFIEKLMKEKNYDK